MAHLTGGAFTNLKEALAYDRVLDDQKSGQSVNPLEMIESDVSTIAIEGLENLYGGLYSLYQFLQIQGVDKHNLRAWLLYRNKNLSAVFLFFIDRTHLRVVTEMMAVTESDLSCFTKFIFGKYKNLKSIEFNASELPLTLPSYPHQIFDCSENYIIDLPSNSEHYLLSLGRSTRKTIKSSNNKFRRDFSDFLFRMSEVVDVSLNEQKEILKKLQRFKQASMEARLKAVIFDEVENQRLLMLIAERGVFSQVMIQGEMRAGSIACRVGNNIVMLISAADPKLSSYRLDFLVCYWTICECIQCGIRQCHLLWGRYQYKTQLGAQSHALMRAIFYRSYLAMIFSPLTVMRMFSKKISMQCRNWILHNYRHNPNKSIQQILRCLRSLRTNWQILSR